MKTKRPIRNPVCTRETPGWGEGCAEFASPPPPRQKMIRMCYYNAGSFPPPVLEVALNGYSSPELFPDSVLGRFCLVRFHDTRFFTGTLICDSYSIYSHSNQHLKQSPATRPIPIVLVKCWKVAHWNAKKLLKNCQKSKKLLPKFQKLLPKFLAIFV